MTARPIAPYLVPAAIGLVLLALPFMLHGSYILHLIIIGLIYAVIASSWDLSLGYAGIFNMAHIAFFGVGIYTCAILAKTLGINPWLAILTAGLAAVLLSGLIWLPILRLRGIYVILVTFAVAQLILRIILSQNEITGGAKGMVFLPPLAIGNYSFNTHGKLGYYYVALALLAVSTLFFRVLVSLPFGRSIVALRDNEDYAVSRGISIARQRLLTLMASAVFTGIAGGLYTLYIRVASPEIFGFDFLTLILSMVLFGGAASIYGPIVGTMILLFVSEAMFGWGPWRYMINAVLIIIVMLFFPGGVLGLLKSAYGALRPRLARARTHLYAAKVGAGARPK